MPKNIDDVEEYEDVEDEEENEQDRGDAFDEEDEDLEEEKEDEEDPEDEEEEEEDPEDEEDDKEDEEDQEDDEDDVKDIKIPKSRLDQVVRQREEERERSKWLESQLEKLLDREAAPVEKEEEVVDPFDYDSAELKFMELVQEGETAKASKVRNLINKSRQEDLEVMIASATKGITEKANTQSTEMIENDRFNDLIETYEGLHTFLDAESTDFDEEKTEMVNTLLAGYASQGKTKRQSLKLAVNKVLELHPVKKEKVKLGSSKRTQKSRKKSATASNTQPPKTRSASMKSKDMDSVDIDKMSDRDYRKLTLKERKILRGDVA